MDPLTHIVVGRAVVAAFDGDGPAARRRSRRDPWRPRTRHRHWCGPLWLGPLPPASTKSEPTRQPAPCDGGPRWPPACGSRRDEAVLNRRGDRGLERPTPCSRGHGSPATISHLGLDLVSGARIRVGWPFVQQRVSLPLVAMADPWLIGICVAGLLAFWPGGTRFANSGAGDTRRRHRLSGIQKVRCSTTLFGCHRSRRHRFRPSRRSGDR